MIEQNTHEIRLEIDVELNQKHLEKTFEIGIFSDGLFEKYNRSY